jgi:transcriptional regulator with XRE-family HTH domain
MLLIHLKACRMAKGYSLADLAEKTGINKSNISLLENLKRSPHGKTVRTLAAALEVEVTDLYEPDTSAYNLPIVNANETPTVIFKPARPTRATRVKTKPAGNFWIMDEDGRDWGPYSQEEATERQVKFGQARIYEGKNKFEVWDKHRAFLIRVARGHDAW